MNQTKEEYFKNLPTKRIGAGVLFFNLLGEVLVVEPTYKDTWEIPGGVVECGESPRDGAIREVKEEIGLMVSGDSLNLIGAEYMAAGNEITEGIMFVFSGGNLSEEEIREIRVDGEEISSFQFASGAELYQLLGPVLGARVRRCVGTREFVYSEGEY